MAASRRGSASFVSDVENAVSAPTSLCKRQHRHPTLRGERTMRYMLMMNAPRGTREWQPASWSPADFTAHMEYMHALNRELITSREPVLAEACAARGQA